MNHDREPLSPLFLPDWAWDVIGVHVVVLLGSYLLYFFAVASPELRIMLGVTAWLTGLHLATGLPRYPRRRHQA